MLRNAFHGLAFLGLAALSCRADLTLRYSVDVKSGLGMPAATSETLKQALANIPRERLIQIKGDKTRTNSGALIAITDNALGEITLLDPATKKYARTHIAEFVTAIQGTMPAFPAAAEQALQNMKFDIQTTTGQIGMVSGIRAQERVTTMTMSMNIPGFAASDAFLRMEMHIWRASPDDLSRVSGLREYAAYAQRALDTFNSIEQVEKMFGQIPGMGDKIRAVMQELSKDTGSLTVKTQQTIYMPIAARVVPGANPDSPLMEMRSDLTTISSDAIDDAVFEVPADYQTESLADIVKAMNPGMPKAPASKSVPPARPDLAPDEPILSVGGGVSPASVIFRVDPEYSEEARQAKLSGTVLLSVVVDTEGAPRNIQVVRSLGLGLDQKAIDAVSRWKFRPGMKNGQPVNVRANIEVNFKLLTDPLPQ